MSNTKPIGNVYPCKKQNIILKNNKAENAIKRIPHSYNIGDEVLYSEEEPKINMRHLIRVLIYHPSE
jgi:hypothetical protein